MRATVSLKLEFELDLGSEPESTAKSAAAAGAHALAKAVSEYAGVKMGSVTNLSVNECVWEPELQFSEGDLWSNYMSREKIEIALESLATSVASELGFEYLLDRTTRDNFTNRLKDELNWVVNTGALEDIIKRKLLGPNGLGTI
jgi:hypothetical protein